MPCVSARRDREVRAREGGRCAHCARTRCARSLNCAPGPQTHSGGPQPSRWPGTAGPGTPAPGRASSPRGHRPRPRVLDPRAGGRLPACSAAERAPARSRDERRGRGGHVTGRAATARPEGSPRLSPGLCTRRRGSPRGAHRGRATGVVAGSEGPACHPATWAARLGPRADFSTRQLRGLSRTPRLQALLRPRVRPDARPNPSAWSLRLAPVEGAGSAPQCQAADPEGPRPHAVCPDPRLQTQGGLGHMLSVQTLLSVQTPDCRLWEGQTSMLSVQTPGNGNV